MRACECVRGCVVGCASVRVRGERAQAVYGRWSFEIELGNYFTISRLTALLMRTSLSHWRSNPPRNCHAMSWVHWVGHFGCIERDKVSKFWDSFQKGDNF